MHPNDGRVVSNFILWALQGQDIKIYGDGSHTRSFCYIDDLLDGLIKMMATEDNVTGPINLGSPEELSIRALAEQIILMTNSTSKIINIQTPLDDPKRRKPVILSANTLLNWLPKETINNGLRETIEYFQGLNIE